MCGTKHTQLWQDCVRSRKAHTQAKNGKYFAHTHTSLCMWSLKLDKNERKIKETRQNLRNVMISDSFQDCKQSMTSQHYFWWSELADNQWGFVGRVKCTKLATNWITRTCIKSETCGYRNQPWNSSQWWNTDFSQWSQGYKVLQGSVTVYSVAQVHNMHYNNFKDYNHKTIMSFQWKETKQAIWQGRVKVSGMHARGR